MGAMLFPFDRPGIKIPDNYQSFHAMETLSKVSLWNGSEVWVASKYDHVRAILKDNRFSAGSHHANFPGVSESRKTLVDYEPKSMIRMDVPEHTTIRRMFSAEFQHSRIEAMQPMVDRIVDELITDMLEKGPPTDFVQAFALAMPSYIIAEMLGVPHCDHEFFQERSLAKMVLSTDPQIAIKAGEEQREYLYRMMREKSKNPEAHDDLIGRMISKHINTGELSIDDVVATIELLLLAGHETTANMTALGTISLLQNREAFEMVRNDVDGEITKRAVEEMLRYHAVAQATSARVALEDVEVGGVVIKKGEGVLALVTPANHDPEKFKNPESFNMMRELIPPHLAFGFGVHQCLGQTLARAEMKTAFRALTRRIPTLDFAVPIDTLSYKGYSMVFGVYSLPVKW